MLGLVLLQACQKELVIQQTKTQQYVFNNSEPQPQNELNTFIRPYRDSLDAKVNKVLAFSEAELLTGRSGLEMKPAQVALGNFTVDACMEVARQKAKALGKPEPDFSIFTWGSIRKSLPAGNITLRNIYELMPFENEMVVLKLNGKQTGTLLNKLAERFNPIAGATVNKSETNTITINSAPLDENRFYYVVVSDYLSFGNDELTVLSEASDRYWCGIKVRDAIVQYLETLTLKGQTLKPNYEQRIRK